MRLLDLALKDLSQIVRDRRSAIFLLAMPIVFTVFMGLAFRWPSQTDTRSYIGVINLDQDSLLADGLRTLMDSSGLLNIRVYEPGDTARVEAFVRQRRLDAEVVVPSGYTRAMMSGTRVPLAVVCDENTPDGQAAYRAVEVAATRLGSAVLGTNLVQQAERRVTSDEGQATVATGHLPLSARDLLLRAIAAWQRPAYTVTVSKAGGGEALQQARLPTSYQQASPGTLVQFAIFSLITSAMLLVLERKNRALERLLTTSITKWEVVIGHTLAIFIVVLVQGLLLIGFGELVFRVGYLHGFLPVLLVLVCLALWVTGLGMLVGTIARGQEQVTAWAMVAMFVLSAGGGCWFPLEVTGRAFSRIGHILPSAWAMQGFQNIVVRGLGFNSVLLPCAVMLVYALAFMALAVWRFRADA